MSGNSCPKLMSEDSCLKTHVWKLAVIRSDLLCEKSRPKTCPVRSEFLVRKLVLARDSEVMRGFTRTGVSAPHLNSDVCQDASFQSSTRGYPRGGARAESCAKTSFNCRSTRCDGGAGSIWGLKKESRLEAGRAHSELAMRQQQSWF